MCTYAGNRPLWLSATGISEAWLDTAARIVHDGIPGQWDGLPLRELPRATVEVDVPAPDDQLSHCTPIPSAWPGCTSTSPTARG